MKDDIRNSKMFFKEVYFWTDTIKDWKPLLKNDTLKKIIIQSWQTLVQRKKIVVYGFVIMPNHLHVMWEMIAKNGKEMPYASFNKFTAHQFLDYIRMEQPSLEVQYKVQNDAELLHRFWQRDALAINLNTPANAEQKLEYIHLNPLQERWSLANKPEDYRWSSAKFYETGIDEFNFLTHYKDRF